MILLHKEYTTLTYVSPRGLGAMVQKNTFNYLHIHYGLKKKTNHDPQVWRGVDNPSAYVKRKIIWY